MIKYRVMIGNSIGTFIQKKEVERETESSIWIDGVRSAKKSMWDNYFDTYDEAKEFLLRASKNRVRTCVRMLEQAEAKRDMIKNLTEE